MVENDLSERDLKDQEETVAIRRGPAGGTVVNHQPVIYQGSGAGSPATATAPRPIITESLDTDNGEGESAAPPIDIDSKDLVAIESPMVGTFYASPNPDSGPFVSSGSAVSADNVVCLIEAMKVFNEIKAEVNGTIERVLVKNGDAVEFGQRLFLVRPS